MRQFARWQRLARPAAVSSLAAFAILATALISAAPASAASNPITAAWGAYSYIAGTAPAVKVAETGINQPTTLTYTILGGTDGISDLSFTDTLPTAVKAVLFDGGSTAGTYTTCGSAYDDSANVPGTSKTITINDVNVAAAGTCTIVFYVVPSVTAQATADVTDAISDITATDPVTTDAITPAYTDAAALTVLPNPTVAFTSPVKGKTYSYGEEVAASYTCNEPGDTAAGVAGTAGPDELYPFAQPICDFAGDNDGAEVDYGGYLDTLEGGKNALTVTAENLGTGIATPSVSYTVKPFVVSGVKSSKTTALNYSVKLPIAGKLVTKVLDGKKTVASFTKTVTKAGTVKPVIRLNAEGKKLLKASKSKTKHLTTKVEVTFTPSGSAEENSSIFGNFSPEGTTVTKTGVSIK